MTSIKLKLFKGAAWNGLNQVGTQILNMAITLILANLLTPKEFGIFGNVMIFFFLSQMLLDLGITGALLSIKNIDEDIYNDAFWLLLFAIFFFSPIIYFSSAIFSYWYEDGEMIKKGVWLVSSTFLIFPLYKIAMVIEIKKLQYNRITMANLISIIVSGVFTLLFIKAGFLEYSLLIQFFIKNTVNFIILIIFIGWIPNRFPNLKKIYFLLKIGIGYFLNNLILYFSANIDFLLVGKYLGSSMMGLYTMSFRIAKYPLVKFFEIIGRMLFPAFVELKDNNVMEKYFRITALGSYIIIPVIIILFFTVDYIFIILLKPEWDQIINIIRIILFYSIFSALSFSDKEILKAFNKVMKINIYRLITLGIFIISGLFVIEKFRLEGIAHIYGICQLLNIIIIHFYLQKVLKVSFRQTIYYMRKVLIEIIILITFSFIIKYFLSILLLNAYVNFVIYIISFTVVLFLVSIFNRVIVIKSKRIGFGKIN